MTKRTIENADGFEVTLGDGRTITLTQSVTTEHGEAIHAALETGGSERRLQRHLENIHWDEYFDDAGEYVGPDIDGLGLSFAG